jgi:hypothetical protein
MSITKSIRFKIFRTVYETLNIVAQIPDYQQRRSRGAPKSYRKNIMKRIPGGVPLLSLQGYSFVLVL